MTLLIPPGVALAHLATVGGSVLGWAVEDGHGETSDELPPGQKGPISGGGGGENRAETPGLWGLEGRGQVWTSHWGSQVLEKTLL